MTRPAPPTRFAGIDSEGAQVNGRHRLVVLAAADAFGRSMTLRDAGGIDTLAALAFLERVRAEYAPRRLVVFSGRYDVAQWLSGAPRRVLAELWENGEARWYRKAAASGPERVNLHLRDGHSFGFWTPGMSGGRVRVTDVWGLFQSSFVDACDAWGEPVTAEIAWGKQARSGFDASDPGELERAESYCVSECAALARIMGRVALAARRVGIRPGAWSGAGPLGASLLARHESRRVLREPRSEDAQLAVLTAYYGGRVDMLAQGECEQVAALDLRSAYPAALAGAPSMIGTWRSVTPAKFNGDGFAVWRARFASPELRPLSPLPIRQPGRVVWPARGEGWWHACELAAAIRAGAEVDVLEGFAFTPRAGEPAEPWAWIRDVYALRAELRAAGDPAELIVKAALNSLYGKLAQNVGNATYSCFALAGYVTAATRARVLDVANLAAGRVVSIHTDGILFAGAAPLVALGDGLGEWSRSAGSELLIVQPGVYTYDDAAGEQLVSRRLAARTRGVPADVLSWDRIHAEWRASGVGGRVTVTRELHHGIGTCAGRRRWATLGQWVRESRDVAFSATSRFPAFSDEPLQAMLPVPYGGVAIPFEPLRERDADELLRREQPYPTS